MSRSMKSTLQVLIAFVFMFGAFGTSPVRSVEAASANVVISEVYGGGGNSGANLKNDFIELFNLGSTAVDLSTWSVQYTSSGGTTWTNKTDLTGSIPAGGYYLIQEAAGTGGTVDLPTPDVTGSIGLSGTSGKVALVSNQITLTGSGLPIPAGVVDFVGYGSATAYEGAATPALTSTTSASRTIVCMDVDDNKAEFSVVTPTPQNSATPASPCSADAVYVTTNPINGSTGVLLDANLILKFNKAVTPLDGWYTLNCTLGGLLTPAVSIDGTTITLNPVDNFKFAEACTLTITGSLVDANMAYSPTIRFSTAANMADACGDLYTPISVLQGLGSASPYAGLQLATEGVVTADLQATKKGFYIQDPTPDADSSTSEGMFIYTESTTYTVPLGALVRVTGTVTELGGLTEMTAPFPRMLNCGASGVTIPPVELSLPFTDSAYPERFENMLVTFPQALIISEYFNFDRFGEIVLTSERHMTPTAMVEPGLPAQAAAAANLLDRITLDDGRTNENPDPAIHPNGLTFDMSNLFRGGDTVQNMTGVMDYAYSLYRIQPTASANFAAMNTRRASPEIIEANLKIASFNVLNYFVTLDNDPAEIKDQPADLCGPLGGQDCRGADDAGEFDRQKAKILAALTAIDADIFGLMEIENDSSVSGNNAVADMVAGLNAIVGAGTYDYIVTGAIGGDAIKQAILYKPASVTPVSAYQLLTSAVDARFIDTRNRPALAQVFTDNKTGIQFVVAVNHLKSKGSACDGDPDLGDGQGNCNLTRKAAAQALVDWLANPTYFPGVQKTLIIGDLNSYDKEDPIDMIKLGADDTPGTADDFKDMIFEKRGENAYGYVFDGQIGYLDHALANQQMAQDIVDVNFWHINADEPDLIDYDTTFKGPNQDALYTPDAYRSSDHDPVIITLTLKAILFLPLISK